jgi:hypothetical protein
MAKKALAILFVFIALISAAALFLIPIELVEQFGQEIYYLPAAVLVISLALVFFFSRKITPKGEKHLKRQELLIALKEAEKQFLQHKIDKPTFDKISQEKNSELILVEAKIDMERKKDISKEDLKKVERLNENKKDIILGLLEQKQLKVHELKIAENKMYKRRINEATFQKLSSEIKMELISIESQIKAIYANEEIEALKETLKLGAKEIAKQKTMSEERKRTNYFKEVEEDVIEQNNPRAR